MTVADPIELFFAAPPGLEQALLSEAQERGFASAAVVPGGVTAQGDWPEVWRANLELRGAGRVLARIAQFRVMHLAQLDKRSKKVPWGGVLRPDVPVKVEATCRKSKIYHAGAATQRVEGALAAAGIPVSAEAKQSVRVRIEDDLCEISLDTSGAPLHQRGSKQAVGKAPMRETLAALFLREMGFNGSQPVVDPMCGSGTFVLEAAEISAGLSAGRNRGFAFENFANFDEVAWAEMKAAGDRQGDPHVRHHGFDRDTGAIRNSTANAERAGVSGWTRFQHQPIADLTPPEGPPGIVIVNPPYGARIGNRKLLFGLYGTLGKVLQTHFKGWRAGIVTSDKGLARATGLRFAKTSAPIPHGGLKVQLFQTGVLA